MKYILTATNGTVLIVKPNTEKDVDKFLSVRGARWISESTKKENEGNLTDEAADHEQAVAVNDFVGGCECWRFKDSFRVS